MRIPYTISDDSVTIFAKGGIHTMQATNPNFEELVELLRGDDHDEEQMVDLINQEQYVSRKVAGTSGVTVANGTVYYEGTPVHNTLTERLLDLLDEGLDVTPWANFLSNLMDNPSYRSRESLYDFLEHFKAPITEDGCFIAFKRVRSDFTDLHTGKFDNSPGKVVSMPRHLVDDDNQRTCSAGLHVCADEYLKGYAVGATTLAVKVNPRDVVSVPYDYNFSKMRTCQYEVLNVVTPKQQQYIIDTNYFDDGMWDDDDPFGDDFY